MYIYIYAGRGTENYVNLERCIAMCTMDIY